MALYHHKEVFREIPAGSPAEGISVSFWRLYDDTQIGSPVVTNANGEAFKSLATTATSGALSYELHPGPYRTEASSSGGVHREKSSVTIGSAGALDLSSQIFLNRAMGSGVSLDPGSGLGDMELTATGSTMVLTMSSGAGCVQGIPWFNEVARSFAIPAEGTLTARIDSIVVEVVPQGNDREGRVVLKRVAGTVEATPPTLQTDDELWQEELYRVEIGNGVSVLTTGDLTDTRDIIERSVSDVADDLTALEADVLALQTPSVPRVDLVGYYQDTVQWPTLGSGGVYALNLLITFAPGFSSILPSDSYTINHQGIDALPHFNMTITYLGESHALAMLRNLGAGSSASAAATLTVLVHRLVLS